MGLRKTICLALLCFTHYAQAAPVLKPAKLTCEYLENPRGIATAKPRFSWILTGDGHDQWQSAYEIVVTDPAKNIVWQTGKVNTAQNLHVEYAGKPLLPFSRYTWQVKVYDQHGRASSWSTPQWFETASADWAALWIGDGSRQFEKDEDFYQEDPMPLFRKSFETKKKIASARLYISGLGYYEAYLNGQKIGDHVLDPGLTAYSKQVLYTVYDITPQVRNGVNAASIMLGNGWYNTLPLRFWGSKNMRAALTTGRPCVKALIRITYADGTTSLVPTDETWQTAPGPVVRNSIFLGEHYDARLEAPQTGWKQAVKVQGPTGILTPQMQPPIRVTKVVKPVSINEIKPGVFILDMGQNFAGVVRLKVKGPAGTKVSIRYGEDKYPDGSLNVMTAVAGQIKKSNGGPGAPPIAWQEDSYTLKGKGLETWAPRFTFHGFRFIEVTGWPGKPTLQDIEGLRMNSDLQKNGTFSSSNSMFSKLDETIQWTFLSNVFSVESDCPAREKLQYGGDILCVAETYMYNYDMPQFYAKTIRDLANDQRPLGGITETAPYVGIADKGPGDGSGPMGWQAAYPYLIKKMYEYYGDKRIIEENYEAVARLIAFLEASAENNLSDKDLGDHEALDGRSAPLTASAFYLMQVRAMAEFAEVLHKEEDKAKYTALAETIRKAIVQKFYVNGAFENATQTAQIVGLWSNLIKDTQKAADTLNAVFAKHNWHLSTGIFGTKMLFDVLRESDQNDIAYRIADQRSFPGWGYMLDSGATTLWETWAASDNTYSKNHPMFGSIGEWFYRSLLGINPAAPGFKKIIIKPQPAGDLTFAKGSYNSPYGPISSDWKITNGKFSLKVNIPANTSAEVWVPLKYGKVSGAKMLREEKGYAVFERGSGNYTFVSY
ncbi:Bacterial alpha-L-rhamnosidase [Chitinophaga sp. SYP-B3965]|uniref:family 78 glycoside hydrolase catalytic domain n=1 Tax=Chitinophaga sp. SYP-B3965 TaxID=2663120 RepID=UPI0012998115|nr:family 78 glycoside hydrolase catalytic domain [Chitinophaga sp. SYP-B3965]MRG44143.1 Bacterial alpha-L-rhamnosidase [Chitinophaga sp. SYP-B3965]